MPEERQIEPPEKKKKAPERKKVIGNVERPDSPETRRSRRPTYEHG